MKMTNGLHPIMRASHWHFTVGATQNQAPLPPLTLASPPGLPNSQNGGPFSYFLYQTPARILDLPLVLSIPYLHSGYHQISHALPNCSNTPAFPIFVTPPLPGLPCSFFLSSYTQCLSHSCPQSTVFSHQQELSQKNTKLMSFIS